MGETVGADTAASKDGEVEHVTLCGRTASTRPMRPLRRPRDHL